MSLQQTISNKVINEVITKTVSLLSSISSSVKKDHIEAIVLDKLENLNLNIRKNNDLGMCIEQLYEDCLLAGVSSTESLDEKYNTIKQNNELVTETLSKLSNSIAKNISPILYEIREVIPSKSNELINYINKYAKTFSDQNNVVDLKVFDWGKLGNPNVLQATMIIGQDRTNSFKDGIPRQNDPTYILKKVPYQTVSSVSVNKDIFDKLITDFSTKHNSVYTTLAFEMITQPHRFESIFLNMKKNLNEPINFGQTIISTVEKIDAIENVLRDVTAQSLGKYIAAEDQPLKIFDNIENCLTNLALIRASLIYHKAHTLQNKLLLTPDTIQASIFEKFKEVGGTEQMIKDHLLYRQLNSLSEFHDHGYSMDVVLNTNEKAKTTISKNTETVKRKLEEKRLGNLQFSVTKGLEDYHYSALEADSSIKHKTSLHRTFVKETADKLRKNSVDDIAIEYLVTMEDKPTLVEYYTKIGTNLKHLIKSNAEITNVQVSESICSAVIDIILLKLQTNFTSNKKAA